MSLQGYTRRASESGALLVLCSLLLHASADDHTLSQGCQPTRIDEQVEVTHVYDGDTVKLADGRRVRFIGINTPEIGHYSTVTQPYAEAARKSLQEMLETAGNRLALQYGKERNDHYGRLLAHAYLSNGDSVAARLLRQGYATTLVVPPNTAFAECFRQLEQEARSDSRGLWQLTAYQPRDAGSLPGDAHGFYIVRGQVSGITRSLYQVRITLEGKLAARISSKDLGNFEPGYLEKLLNHRVELRGWIKPEKGGLGIRVRHPAALTLVGDPPRH